MHPKHLPQQLLLKVCHWFWSLVHFFHTATQPPPCLFYMQSLPMHHIPDKRRFSRMCSFVKKSIICCWVEFLNLQCFALQVRVLPTGPSPIARYIGSTIYRPTLALPIILSTPKFLYPAHTMNPQARLSQ